MQERQRNHIKSTIPCFVAILLYCTRFYRTNHIQMFEKIFEMCSNIRQHILFCDSSVVKWFEIDGWVWLNGSACLNFSFFFDELELKLFALDFSLIIFVWMCLEQEKIYIVDTNTTIGKIKIQNQMTFKQWHGDIEIELNAKMPHSA